MKTFWSWVNFSWKCTPLSLTSSSCDVLQRFIFPCYLVRSRIHLEMEKKLFSKSFYMGQSLWFRPHILNPQTESDLMLKFFFQRQDLKFLRWEEVSQVFQPKDVNRLCERLFLLCFCFILTVCIFFEEEVCWQGEEWSCNFTPRNQKVKSHSSFDSFPSYCFNASNFPNFLSSLNHTFLNLIILT